MSNLEKIQKGMRVLKTLSKIILIFAIVGLALTSVGAILVASDEVNTENQFFHFLFAAAEITKGQLIGTLLAETTSLLLSGIFMAFVYRYFTAELKEETPFTNTGADRIKQLGIMQIVLALVSAAITDAIYDKINLSDWNRFDGVNSIVLGICLILIATVVRYGAELEHRKQS